MSGRSRPGSAPRGRHARRTGMHGYQQRPGRPPVVAVMLVAVMVVAAVVVAVVLVAFARSPEAAGYDQATIRACEAAKKAMGGRGEASWRSAGEAIEEASASGEAELREIADSYAPDGTEWGGVRAAPGASEISEWCGGHGMG